MAENANTHDGYTAYVNAAFADKNTNYDELKEVVLKNPNMKQYMSDEQSRRLGAGLMSRKIGIDTSQFTEADWYELKKNNPEKYKLAVAYGNEMRKVGLEVFRDEPNVKKIQAWVEENKNKPNSAGKDGERGQIISKIVESGVIDKDGNFSFGGLMKFLWSNPMILFSLIGIIGLPGFVLGKLF